MSNPLPAIYGSSQQVRYPFTRIVSFETGITTMFNGMEKRFVSRPPLTQFVIPLAALNTTDRNAYLTLFNTLKGQFAQNITLTLGSTTYTDLTLTNDHLNMNVRSAAIYEQQIELRQVKNSTYSAPGSVPAAFPNFDSTSQVLVEYPLTTQTGFLSGVNDQPSGPRYVFSYYGASLSGFPTGALKSWKLGYPLLRDIDVSTLETFFMGVQGRYGSFSFTDPTDGNTYNNCRLDTDTLALRYNAFGNTSTELTIVQTNA